MRKDNKIIRIADLIKEKLYKEQELEFYEVELKKLLVRMMLVQREINVTEIIINMIEHEAIPNILEDIFNEEVK